MSMGGSLLAPQKRHHYCFSDDSPDESLDEIAAAVVGAGVVVAPVTEDCTGDSIPPSFVSTVGE